MQKSIVQDEQGFMWFGGDNGLARFDGEMVKTYLHDPNDPSSLSHNDVQDLMVDRRGRLWVATLLGVNLYDKEIDGFKRFLSIGQLNLQSDDAFRAIAEDANGHIWLGSMRGIARINGDSLVPEWVPVETTTPVDLDNEIIWDIVASKSGVIWLSVGRWGLMKYEPDSGQLNFPKGITERVKGSIVYKIFEHPNGEVWLATDGIGLLRLNPNSGHLKQYLNDPEVPHSLHHNTLWDLFIDHDGNFWVAADDALEMYIPELDGFRHFEYLPGTGWYGKARAIYENRNGDVWFGMFPSGIAYLDRDAAIFRNYRQKQGDPQSLSNSTVTAIVEDRFGNLWVGTENGLNYFDRKTQRFTRYLHEPGNLNSLPANSILSLAIDHDDTLWVGTWKGGWASFNETSQQFERARVAGGSTDHWQGQIWSMYVDREGTVWAGGLYRYERSTKLWTHYRDVYPQGDELSTEFVRDAFEDSYGNFWLATNKGLDLFDRVSGKITRFKADRDQPGGLSDNSIVALDEDQQGRLLIGTSNGGVNIFNHDQKMFQVVRSSEGLPDNSIVGLIDDYLGNLWMISRSGLIQYQKRNGRYKLFDRSNGLSGDLFHRNALTLTMRGEVVFGGGNGLTILDPADLQENTTIPPVVITGLDVLNQGVGLKTHRGILDRPINYAQKINLRHSQNIFTLHFAALNYRLPHLNQYAYKLEGFNSEWIESGNVNSVTYTNLDSGSYVFKVKASNNSGLWNDRGAILKIDVQPPWWKTQEAYFFFLLCAALLIALVLKVVLRLREAHSERLINRQLREVDRMKDAFMANTSHELRTPLNGIIGLTEWVLSQASDRLPEEALSRLHLVVSSGKRLSNIVNDILDFSKLKNHDIVLHKSEVDLFALVASTLDIAAGLVNEKSLVLINDVAPDFPKFMADEQRLNQILYNLVGNGIKFTPQGEVRVSAYVADEFVKIIVSDTGIGIGENDLQRIFMPFEQALIKAKGKFVGTGLGLAITKQLVELHGGQVDVQSRVGQGATFSIQIPFAEVKGEGLKSTSWISPKLVQPLGAPKSEIVAKPAICMTDHKVKKSRILVVDDEPVNRIVLDGLLRQRFSDITECANGMEALNLLKGGEHFDIVLLDVMMPGLSGYEVCREIRKSYHELELPVIFLTAKSQREDLNEGYQAGANDFLFKPVVKEEFLMKVNMHLKSKRLYLSRLDQRDQPVSKGNTRGR